MVLVTGNDMVNLEAAADIARATPALAGKVVVHLADIGMKRTLKGGPSGALPVAPDHVFNAHRIAARHLVLGELRGHFARTRARDVVVVAGFGRFGQTLLEVLQGEAAGGVGTVVIVDRQADMRARQFDDQIGFTAGHERHVIRGDMDDPDTWRRVEVCVAHAEAPVFLIGSDDDATNLRAALGLRRRRPHARVVVRCFHDSAFTRGLSADGGFEAFGVSALLRDSLLEQHRGWFGH